MTTTVTKNTSLGDFGREATASRTSNMHAIIETNRESRMSQSTNEQVNGEEHEIEINLEHHSQTELGESKFR